MSVNMDRFCWRPQLSWNFYDDDDVQVYSRPNPVICWRPTSCSCHHVGAVPWRYLKTYLQ